MASCVHERLSLVPEKMVLIRVSGLWIMCAVPAWAGEPVHIPCAAPHSAWEAEVVGGGWGCEAEEVGSDERPRLQQRAG